jgi:hypothetical protein
MQRESVDYRLGLVASLVGDGRHLLALVALSLILSGGFAIFQSASGHFLPHDVQFLGMDKAQLCGLNQCRIVHFMFHDRVSFGGALIAIGCLYLWLLQFPLREGASWAWWLFLVSGVTGFGSFLTYLGYGYLDSWHGFATVLLLIPYVWGMIRTRRTLALREGFRALWRPGEPLSCGSTASRGRVLLLATAVGMICGGLTIMMVGMTRVFVPQDLSFMGLNVAELDAINPRLIPLIAHDRAGFGGGVATVGVVLFFCLWCGRASRSLWQAVVISGTVGFACAIGIHPLIGYTDFLHLLPAYFGALMFAIGISLTRRKMLAA